jgi:hypothetical protein
MDDSGGRGESYFERVPALTPEECRQSIDPEIAAATEDLLSAKIAACCQAIQKLWSVRETLRRMGITGRPSRYEPRTVRLSDVVDDGD